MHDTGLPDAGVLVPLQCPISTSILAQLPPVVRVLFTLINAARLSGSRTDLAHAQTLASADIDLGPSGDGLDWKLALDAARGDCLTIEGRWSGDQAKIGEGVKLIRGFVKAVDRIEGSSPSQKHEIRATQIRAHAYLGNALTRLAYVSHRAVHIQDAIQHIEKQRTTHEDKDTYFPSLIAGIHRDLGDAYIGQLHWSKSLTLHKRVLDALDAAGAVFKEQAEKGDHRAFVEWAATLSSLAVAQAKTAELLKDQNPKIEETGEARVVKVGSDLCTGSREKRARELVDDAERTAWRIWKVYVGLLNQPTRLSFRWARTVSNLAFAGTYIYKCDPERLRTAGMAEAAFLAVTGRASPEFTSAVTAPLDSMWYAGGLDESVHYTQGDHPDRYRVNLNGLQDLYKSMQKE